MNPNTRSANGIYYTRPSPGDFTLGSLPSDLRGKMNSPEDTPALGHTGGEHGLSLSGNPAGSTPPAATGGTAVRFFPSNLFIPSARFNEGRANHSPSVEWALDEDEPATSGAVGSLSRPSQGRPLRRDGSNGSSGRGWPPAGQSHSTPTSVETNALWPARQTPTLQQAASNVSSVDPAGQYFNGPGADPAGQGFRSQASMGMSWKSVNTHATLVDSAGFRSLTAPPSGGPGFFQSMTTPPDGGAHALRPPQQHIKNYNFNDSPSENSAQTTSIEVDAPMPAHGRATLPGPPAPMDVAAVQQPRDDPPPHRSPAPQSTEVESDAGASINTPVVRPATPPSDDESEVAEKRREEKKIPTVPSVTQLAGPPSPTCSVLLPGFGAGGQTPRGGLDAAGRPINGDGMNASISDIELEVAGGGGNVAKKGVNRFVNTKLGNGRFIVKSQVGAGSFGQLFWGVDTWFNKEVAIKLEPVKARQPQLRFESRVYKALQTKSHRFHPSITRIRPEEVPPGALSGTGPNPMLPADAKKFKALERSSSAGRGRSAPVGLPATFTEMTEVIGFPQCYYYGTEGDFNIMVMDLLGPSLEDLFNYCNRQFSIKTVCLLADQMLQRLEYLHHKGFIHRDIKPENFAMGGEKETGHHLYLIDFGLAKRYWDARMNQHITYKEGKALTGTARYCSINAHLGIEQSRRDDLESIGYLLLYFLRRGNLPWQGIRGITDPNTKNVRISEKKISTSLETLCRDQPVQILQFMKYVRQLKFEETPHYRACREHFAALLEKQPGAQRDWIYDWMVVRQQERAEEDSGRRVMARLPAPPLQAPMVRPAPGLNWESSVAPSSTAVSQARSSRRHEETTTVNSSFAVPGTNQRSWATGATGAAESRPVERPAWKPHSNSNQTNRQPARAADAFFGVAR